MSEADDGDDGDVTLPILGGIAIGLPLAIVLGLVLLVVVAIVAVFVVILLSAVLGSFVLGVGDDVSTTPQVQFEFEYADGSGQATVRHAGGDPIDADRLRVEVDGQPHGTWAQLGGTDTVEPGDSLDIEDVQPGDEIRLIYSGEDGSMVMAVFEAG